MRKIILWILATLLLVSAPLLAQLPPSGGTVGVYFDVAGTITAATSFPADSVLDAWVIVFWDAAIGGVSYSINPLPAFVSLWVEAFPNGINFGSAFDGCGVEVGFTFPQFGFEGTPVIISELLLFNTGAHFDEITICIEPHCSWGEIVVADNLANLFSASGLCGTVDAEDDSWGAVKNMYR